MAGVSWRSQHTAARDSIGMGRSHVFDRTMDMIADLDEFPYNKWYVNSAATGSGGGSNWQNACITFSAAIDKCSNYDRVYVQGGVSETVDYSVNASGPHRISIIGVDDAIASARWYSVGNTAPMIHLNVYGWTFQNIRFVGPAAYAALYLYEAAASGAYNTTVKDCWFYGVSRKYGIHFYGAPYMCNIVNNWFDGYSVASGYAIYNDNTGFAAVRICQFLGNHFMGNINHVYLNDARDCLFRGNVFQGDGLSVTTDKKLWINAGQNNVVYDNFLGGTDWSIVGGYKGTATDCWLGNITGETGGTKTGAEGGTTAVTPPAS